MRPGKDMAGVTQLSRSPRFIILPEESMKASNFQQFSSLIASCKQHHGMISVKKRKSLLLNSCFAVPRELYRSLSLYVLFRVFFFLLLLWNLNFIRPFLWVTRINLIHLVWALLNCVLQASEVKSFCFLLSFPFLVRSAARDQLALPLSGLKRQRDQKGP